jgi:hypothetical protein
MQTMLKTTNEVKARLIRERAEYLLQVEEIGRNGKYWKTVQRMYFPHLNETTYRGEQDYDDD